MSQSRPGFVCAPLTFSCRACRVHAETPWRLLVLHSVRRSSVQQQALLGRSGYTAHIGVPAHVHFSGRQAPAVGVMQPLLAVLAGDASTRPACAASAAMGEHLTLRGAYSMCAGERAVARSDPCFSGPENCGRLPSLPIVKYRRTSLAPTTPQQVRQANCWAC
jgi:hypothetical protein